MTTNSWVDVEWDMTGTPSDFDRLVLFLLGIDHA